VGSIVVTPKNAEEQDFLMALLKRLGFAAQIHTEDDDESFSMAHELSEAGKVFLEERVQAALVSGKSLKNWRQVQEETAAKFNWPAN
jgi:hypothetical protein